MQKIATGTSFVYSDQECERMESLLTSRKEVKILGTTGDYKTECLMVFLQVAPAMYMKVLGISAEGWQVILDKYEIGRGSENEIARSILKDKVLFNELIGNLIKQDLVRCELFDELHVYFPTETYLRCCDLL